MIPALECILWDLVGRTLHVGATLIIRNNYRWTWGRSPPQMINYTQKDKDALCETLMLSSLGHSRKHQILKINQQSQGKAHCMNTYQSELVISNFLWNFLHLGSQRIPHLQADLLTSENRKWGGGASDTFTECYVIWRQRVSQKNLSSVVLHGWLMSIISNF